MPLDGAKAVDRYFELHEAIKAALRRDDYPAVAKFTRETIPLIPALVLETKQRFGSFDITESVAVHQGGRLLVALGDRTALEDLFRTLSSLPDTEAWAMDVERFLEDLDLEESILSKVREAPGVLQTELKSALNPAEPERVSDLCYWLGRVGRLQRQKKGRSYALHVCE